MFVPTPSPQLGPLVNFTLLRAYQRNHPTVHPGSQISTLHIPHHTSTDGTDNAQSSAAGRFLSERTWPAGNNVGSPFFD